jgi:hypothetical protein
MDADTLHYFREHVKSLHARWQVGDDEAMKSLCCIVLAGHHGGSGGPGESVEFTTFEGDVVDMAEWMRRRAA